MPWITTVSPLLYLFSLEHDNTGGTKIQYEIPHYKILLSVYFEYAWDLVDKEFKFQIVSLSFMDGDIVHTIDSNGLINGY